MSSSVVLTEDQLRASLIKGYEESRVSVVPDSLSFCLECDRYFDVQSGCEADIRFDERNRIRTELIDWLIGPRIDPRNGLLPIGDNSIINGRRIVDEIDRICPKE